uniref:Integrase p58-like C-terminal domain-containing protein n=1 Tax=Strigamia maritima TaxID=126957 RepID=T1J0J1_STRMM
MAVHKVTNHTPMYLFTGRDPFQYYEMLKTVDTENTNFVSQRSERLATAFQRVKSALREQAEKQRQDSLKNSQDKNIKVGDLVYLHQIRIPVGDNRKLAQPNTGPYRVNAKLNEVNFQIRLISAPDKSQIVHADRLKKAVEPRIYAKMEFEESEGEEYDNEELVESDNESIVDDEDDFLRFCIPPRAPQIEIPTPNDPDPVEIPPQVDLPTPIKPDPVVIVPQPVEPTVRSKRLIRIPAKVSEGLSRNQLAKLKKMQERK